MISMILEYQWLGMIVTGRKKLNACHHVTHFL